MSCSSGPRLVKDDNVVFYVDAASPKTYTVGTNIQGISKADAGSEDITIVNDGFPFYYTSASSAGTLGFTFGPADVKGESDSLTACSGLLTFAQAVSFVNAIGARLPTRAEVEAGAAEGSGCSYDAEQIWTCDKANSEGTKHYTIMGDVALYGNETVALDNASTAYVRYVADVDINRADKIELEDAVLDGLLTTLNGPLTYSTTYLSNSTIVSNYNYELLGGTLVQNGYFEFDGIDDNINLNRSLLETNEVGTGDVSYSIEAWVYPTVTPGNTLDGMSIVGHASANGFGLQLSDATGIKVNFGARSNQNFHGTTTLSLNTWYYVVGTREVGVGSRIYVNGELDTTHATLTDLDINDTTDPVEIGFATGRITTRYKGRIGLVKISNTFLTDAEVKENFETMRSRYGI